MTVKSVPIDRRSFLSGAGTLAGAVMATSLVPLSRVHALPSGLALSAAPKAAPVAEGNGHVDDICGHWPPYSHAIGYGQVTAPAASLWAHADPIDHVFLI